MFHPVPEKYENNKQGRVKSTPMISSGQGENRSRLATYFELLLYFIIYYTIDIVDEIEYRSSF